MDKLKELKKDLEKTGLPVAYSHFKKSSNPSLPYIVFIVTDTVQFFADDVVYFQREEITVSLVLIKKDRFYEEKIEEALSAYSYEKEGDFYLEEEQKYIIDYIVEI